MKNRSEVYWPFVAVDWSVFPVSTEDKRAGRMDRGTEATDKGTRRKGNHIEHSSIIFYQGQNNHLLQ